MGVLNRSQGYNIFNSLLVRALFRRATNPITAHVGGGKGSATPLSYGVNRVGTVASAADSLLAPPAVSGAEFILIQDGANSAQVFGQGTDTIDEIATGTGNAVAAAKRVIFVCYSAGKWSSIAGAKTS